MVKNDKHYRDKLVEDDIMEKDRLRIRELTEEELRQVSGGTIEDTFNTEIGITQLSGNCPKGRRYDSYFCNCGNSKNKKVSKTRNYYYCSLGFGWERLKGEKA